MKAQPVEAVSISCMLFLTAKQGTAQSAHSVSQAYASKEFLRAMEWMGLKPLVLA